MKMYILKKTLRRTMFVLVIICTITLPFANFGEQRLLECFAIENGNNNDISAESGVLTDENSARSTVRDLDATTGEEGVNVQEDKTQIPERMTNVITKNNLTLYVDQNTGEFCISNKKTGSIWFSNPLNYKDDKFAKGAFRMELGSQLIVTFISNDGRPPEDKNTLTGSVKKDGAKVILADSGFCTMYYFPDEGVTIPFNVELGEEGFSASVNVRKIKEDSKWSVLNISVLPYFGAGSEKDEGYIFVPDGSGAIINFNNGKSVYNGYSEEVYGTDLIMDQEKKLPVKQGIKMPVYGICRNNHAFLAVIESSEAMAKLNANVSKKRTSYNNVYPEFKLKANEVYNIGKSVMASSKSVVVYEKGKPTVDKCSIKYYLLDGLDADYSGMARRYNKYLMEQPGARSIKSDTTSLFVDLYGAIQKKDSVLGIPIVTTEVLTTYKQAVDMVRRLKEAGVDNVVVRYNMGLSDSIQKLIPKELNPAKQLGGNNGFKEMIASFKNMNVKLYPGEDFVSLYKNGNGFSYSYDAVKTISRILATKFQYRLSTQTQDSNRDSWHLLEHPEVEKAVNGAAESAIQWGIDGIALNSIGAKLYSDFSKDKVSKQMSADIWKEVLNNVCEKGLGVMTDSSNVYAAGYSAYIINAPIDSSKMNIIDQEVPFYQIALAGLVTLAGPSMNMDGQPDMLFLKCLETGVMPHYSWIYADTAVLKRTDYNYLYGTYFEGWVDLAVENYKRILKVRELIGKARFIAHKQLQRDVYASYYDNGVCVIVNYGMEQYQSDSVSVSPMDYTVIRGEQRGKG